VKILSFGEILWDIIDGEKHLGGAPFNLAAHLAVLGAESALISAIGNDRLGAEALARAKSSGIDCAMIKTDDSHITGKVLVSLDSKGIPSYDIVENTAYDFIDQHEVIFRNIDKTSYDVFCFGSLAQRSPVSRSTLEEILKTVKCRNVFYDVNLRQSYYSTEILKKSLSYSSILKLNDEEIAGVSQSVFGVNLAEEPCIRRLFNEFPLKIVCITKGPNGCTIHSAEGRTDSPGVPVKVVDTVGAGDSFSAAFLVKYCKGESLEGCAKFANRIAAFVASKKGAIPNSPEEIRAERDLLTGLS
jgi:fructokinase